MSDFLSASSVASSVVTDLQDGSVSQGTMVPVSLDGVPQLSDSGYLGDAEPSESGASDVAGGINALQGFHDQDAVVEQVGAGEAAAVLEAPAILEGEGPEEEGYGDSDEVVGGEPVQLAESDAMSSSSFEEGPDAAPLDSLRRRRDEVSRRRRRFFPCTHDAKRRRLFH